MLGDSPINSDLAGYYKFEGNSNDGSSYGNNGTDVAMTYGLANGKFGQGALFNGTTSNIRVDSMLTTLANSTKGTISFWANNLEVTNTQCLMFTMFVLSGNNTGIYINFDWRTSTKLIQVICYKDNAVMWSANTATNSLISIAGNYHNFVFVHDGVQLATYLDGIALPITFPTPVDKTLWFKAVITDAVNKAVYVQLASTSYKGKLDKLRIYTSEVWSAARVRKEYSKDRGFI